MGENETFDIVIILHNSIDKPVLSLDGTNKNTFNFISLLPAHNEPAGETE